MLVKNILFLKLASCILYFLSSIYKKIIKGFNIAHEMCTLLSQQRNGLEMPSACGNDIESTVNYDNATLNDDSCSLSDALSALDNNNWRTRDVDYKTK